MGFLQKILNSSMASQHEKKGDSASNTDEARQCYLEVQRYWEAMNEPYRVKSLSVKIGDTHLRDARNKSNQRHQRNQAYKLVIEHYSKSDGADWRTIAIEHCVYSGDLNTIRSYKEMLQDRIVNRWNEFLYGIAREAKRQNSIKELMSILLLETIKSREGSKNNMCEQDVEQFIEEFENIDHRKAELYFEAAENQSVWSLGRSRLYAKAANYFLATGNKQRWLRALEKKHIYYFEEWDYNYTFSNINTFTGENTPSDFRKIERELGKEAAQVFFYNVIPAYFSDGGRIPIEIGLYNKESWPLFCQALIKRVEDKGIDSFVKKGEEWNVKTFIENGIIFNPDLGFRLAKLIKMNEYEVEQLNNKQKDSGDNL